MKTALLILACCAATGAEGLRIANWPTSYPVSNLPAVQPVSQQPAASATITMSVAISSSSVQVAGANPSRKGMMIYNASSSIVYIAYDATASTTHITFPIPASSTWTMPAPFYAGSIAAVRGSTGDGKLYLTELQ